MGAAAGQLPDGLDWIGGFPGVDGRGRPQLAGQLKLALYQVDGDDRGGAGQPGAHDRAQPDAAEAEHGHGRPRLDPGGVDHCPDPGQDRAAQ